MSKGLKQMVAEATRAAQQSEAPVPVHVSGEAIHALTLKMREWSGWPNARLVLGDPRPVSPWAATHHEERTFKVNPDLLVLNPHRVLLTVTPFRLRQEAVLTGSLLHEAGHARHSLWQPRRYGNPDVLKHSDGTDATAQAVALARLMEEPRVEGLIARDAEQVGAGTLDWTMRASAAELLPMTDVSDDPDQQVMDVITSWALRAGRQYALDHWTDHRLRGWVGNFTSLLHSTIEAHLTARQERGAETNPTDDAVKIGRFLITMTTVTDDKGPTMIDMARHVLDLLFPETEEDEDEGKPQPMPGSGCEQGEPEQPEQGEGEGEDDQPKPEQPESGEGEPEQGEPEQSDQQPEEGKGGEPDDSDQPEQEGEGSGEGEGDQPEDGEPEQGEGGASPSTEGEPEQGESEQSESPLAKALAAMEEESKGETEEEVDEDASEAQEEAEKGGGAGAGEGHGSGHWRNPDKDEREMQKGAERFIREMIDATETSKVSLTDTPSATVDGVALSAWKAGGQHSDPNFFVRTRREVQPSPPVKVAILVDVSISMSTLAKPSAILSWALAAAALDLRNFAGRGAQIESCLIHWGDYARMIQAPGEVLPGIMSHSCNEGTSAMPQALALVEEHMPGFFDVTEKPVNRLLVQFTDWELYGENVVPWMQRAMEAGVNMLSVVPSNYRPRESDLEAIMQRCKIQRGATSLLRYNPMFPSQVWDTAAEMLA